VRARARAHTHTHTHTHLMQRRNGKNIPIYIELLDRKSISPRHIAICTRFLQKPEISPDRLSFDEETSVTQAPEKKFAAMQNRDSPSSRRRTHRVLDAQKRRRLRVTFAPISKRGWRARKGRGTRG